MFTVYHADRSIPINLTLLENNPSLFILDRSYRKVCIVDVPSLHEAFLLTTGKEIDGTFRWYEDRFTRVGDIIGNGEMLFILMSIDGEETTWKVIGNPYIKRVERFKVTI